MRRNEISNLAPTIAITMIFGCILAFLLSVGAIPAHAQERGEDAFANGGLMLRGNGVAETVPAMRLGTDIRAQVTGNIARVTVTQAFRNTSDQWMEATYLYPLPDNGAVDTMNMVVGDRIFVGHIKRREEARQIYETALREGRQAGLVEQHRPNMFRNSVANVGPGQTVLIAIEFQAPVRQLGDEYALRMPLVVGPRYVPPETLFDRGGRLLQGAVSDAAEISAPVLNPTLEAGINPVSISIDLAPGFDPAGITSPYHAIRTSDLPGEATRVVLANGDVPADRDFELRWRSADSTPALGLFKQEFNGMHYVMATITPPTVAQSSTIPPREMIFVIDNSGSMGGTSMDAAKDSLLYALDTLRPQDRFNIIRFDSTMTELFEQPVAATRQQLDTARLFTRNLRAAGGTRMLPALQAALDDPNAGEEGWVRQVIFLTDGGLSNEREMMAEISANRGRSAVFMVGIGSAPNNYLMTRMAEAGRGTFSNIGIGQEVETKMRDLLTRLASPVAHSLTITVDGSGLDFTPAELPDLYAGEPLVLLARADRIGGDLTVSGIIDGRNWSTTVNLDQAAGSDAVAKLWARRRVSDIEAQRWSYEIADDHAAAAIARLGLQYHLVTSETSLIAEDETPVRPAGATLVREELPLLLPDGWDFDLLFGTAANDNGTGDVSEADEADQIDLPQTAANFSPQLQSGLLMLILGLIGLALMRRRKLAAREAV